MRDVTLSDIERLEAPVGQRDAVFAMSEEAFRAFYEHTSRPVWVYLARLTGSAAEADDLLQEAWPCCSGPAGGSSRRSTGPAAAEVAVRQADCPREAELLEALRAAWPEGFSDGLRAHVDGCASCTALVEAVLPLLEEHRVSIGEVAVPSSAVMWWRLQMRAQREASAQAMRPIAAVHAVTLACALGVLAATIGLVVPDASDITAWLAAAAAAGTASLPSTAAQLLSPGGIALSLAGALLLIAAPAAIYFALSDR